MELNEDIETMIALGLHFSLRRKYGSKKLVGEVAAPLQRIYEILRLVVHIHVSKIVSATSKC
jgi:hypothetical protein